MKIALVVPGGLHPSGVHEVVPSWLAVFERLARHHDLHAFVLRHLAEAQTYSLCGVTVHDLGRPSAPAGLTRWAQERALLRSLRTHGPFDLVHGFFADPAGQLATRAGKRLGIPSVVTCDSGEFVAIPEINYGSQRSARGRKAVHEACSQATRVHVCTKFMAALAAARHVETMVIPLTSVTSKAATIQRSRLPRTEGPFRLVQVASLSHVKNQRLLLDALAIVRQQIDARLELIGEDTLGGELQQHAARIGLGQSVTFHGFLPQEQVSAALLSADLYVQSSRHEAAGVSVLEAAAFGVPAIGTLAGHVADWAPLKATGVADASPQSLAAAILAAHADPARQRSIADAARAVAIAQDAGYAATRFEELYGSLIR